VDRRILLIGADLRRFTDVAVYPDVASLANNRFDCCNLLQRSIIYHEAGKAPLMISSDYLLAKVSVKKVSVNKATAREAPNNLCCKANLAKRGFAAKEYNMKKLWAVSSAAFLLGFFPDHLD